VFDPKTIDAVILSHTHLDHSGMLPKLMHRGFKGPIYCTTATADLLKILLNDAAGLYFRDIERENLHHQRRGKPLIEAEYTKHDVELVFKHCQAFDYEQAVPLKPSASLRFYDAGHILGSSIIELTLEEKGQTKTLVFSGDLGNSDSALMNDPTKLHHADVVLMEGTYGNRNHRSMAETVEQFADVLSDAWKKGGNVLIPSFAVARTQELLFHLGCLYHAGKLDNWQVFLDSPMAIEVTQLYDRWIQQLDKNDIKHIDAEKLHSISDFLPILNLSQTSDESMAINRIKNGAIIIAGSGMCTGGRIRHHFKHRIWQDNNTIIFVGFQARGTLGRILVDGKKNIKMFGDEFIVRAKIETLGGFSAHAGQSQLIAWLKNFTPTPRVILIHGEPEALDVLSEKLWTDEQIKCEIPAPGHCIAF
jgi:metallo-beta-lactamase family protein